MHKIEQNIVKNVDIPIIADGAPAPRAIRIANCNADGDPHCMVSRNKPAQIHVNFGSHHHSQQVKVTVRANVSGLTVPFPLGKHGDLCQNVFDINGKRTRCPLQPRTQYIYALNLNIPARAPPGSRVRVQLTATDKNRQIFCVQINVLVGRWFLFRRSLSLSLLIKWLWFISEFSRI